ncbi:thymidine kinase [Desulfitobacterium dichloroeliminans LMG P-21439]|uniref:Thymidine kinase n=1 Tax=Desulfitobacterium dichloroeliminans (strain LMG P-21439 / DCA1) TaxID=871963 RepID=L0FBY1_DESDL|nr:thymidine kinase [Desulfitobacterium dichloroeliminans]AGA70727.1 thymidine kinase [Desulfitobacterium dichloroeliminans LMG P-21439]
MAKLYFHFGAMGSSKTANALLVYHNYIDKGQKALIAKPVIETRDGDLIKSRSGLAGPCITLEALIEMPFEALKEYDCIIIDEIQFAKEQQIEFLADIVDTLHIPVMCYGLRTDFRGFLFEGSRRMFELADKIIEIKTVCWCGRKATHNARYNEYGIIREGDQIDLGADEKYISLCRKHHQQGLVRKP